MERIWKLEEFDGDYIIVPTKTLFCPFCGEEMLLHDYMVAQASAKQGGFLHADVHMKCPYCDFWCVFGVPITKDEFEKLRKSKWHRKILRKEILKFKENMKEKLEQFGYW